MAVCAAPRQEEDLRSFALAMRERLRAGAVATPDLDARVLVGAALGEDWTVLLRHPDRVPSVDERRRAEEMVGRRLAGEPVSRILGEREFWGLAMSVSAAVLDPRPDTEAVVERALEIARREGLDAPSVLDLGTGSGCILLALLTELPGARGVGIDRSFEALATARHNAALHKLQARTIFMCMDWDEALSEGFDIIVSNPPYISSFEIAGLAREVAWFDPHLALDGGADGLDAYRRIAPAAQRRLKPGGWLVVETGAGQAQAIRALLEAEGLRPGAGFAPVSHDLAGHERVVSMQRPAAS